MISLLIIISLLYMMSIPFNYCLIFAYLQRGSKAYEAAQRTRLVKDMKFSAVISIIGFLGTPFIFLHIVKHTHRFTGFKVVSKDSLYWEGVAQSQQREDKLSEHRHYSQHRSANVSHAHLINPLGATQYKLILENEAANSVGGRCRSIWR